MHDKFNVFKSEYLGAQYKLCHIVAFCMYPLWRVEWLSSISVASFNSKVYQVSKNINVLHTVHGIFLNTQKVSETMLENSVLALECGVFSDKNVNPYILWIKTEPVFCV